MKRNDKIVELEVREDKLAKSKNPPLCDSCNRRFSKEEDEEKFEIKALLLDGRLWGLVCDDCIKEYFGNLEIKKATERERKGIIRILGKNIAIMKL